MGPMATSDPYGAMGLLDRLLAYFKSVEVGRDESRDERHEQESPEPDDTPDDDHVVGVRRIGAWAGMSSMVSAATIRRDVNFMRATGIRRVDIIVNDDSEERSPMLRFKTYDADMIKAFALDAAAAGIEVHLMSWVMPHPAYIDGLAMHLAPLARDCGALSVVLDAEEPWTLAKRPMSWSVAATQVREALAGIKMGVTAIGYCNKTKLGPLLRVADYWVPQCYSTESQPLDPATVVPRFVTRWRNVFGPDKPIVPGLAGYRQKFGKGIDANLRLAFAGAEALGDVPDVVYWSLAAIRANKVVAKTIKALAAKGQVA